jgi:hypothetical protein
VLSLREKVCLKTEARESRHDRKSKKRAHDASLWHRRLESLLADGTYSDSSIKDAREFLSARAITSPWRWQDFLENEPMGRQKLETWLNTAEKAARRRQQKRIETDAAAIKKSTLDTLSR